MDGLVAMEIRAGNPDFLDLPWAVPVEQWKANCKRLVEVPRGISRHEVVFVQYDKVLYAVKELPPELGEREYSMLRWLEDHELPAVHAAGHARVRHGANETSVLITRFLEGSLPFRTLFENAGLQQYRARLLDAIAGLLVRLHLAGFFWGDCSLSNTLFKRDAGELQAYLVDAETAEHHDELSHGQREMDVAILEENVTGDLLDVAAMLGVEINPAPQEVFDQTGSEIRARYERLWGEVTREEVLAPAESWRIHERIRTLNALGFTVGEVKLEAIGDGSRLRMRTIVTDRDYHRHLLHALTGLTAEDRQAALMVNEVQELRATMQRTENRSVPLAVAAYRWLTERYQPTTKTLAPLVGPRGEPAELYCQMLEHKWYLSERAQRDVGFEHALQDYLTRFKT
jgi:tRNA A-37 threonylcarbamoyl transferase component Bud32